MEEKRYYMISARFNKKANDFGLVHLSDNQYVDANKNIWYAVNLVDIGWGYEYCYQSFKIMPFLECIDIFFNTNLAENIVGFSAYLMKYYGPELYDFLDNNLQIIIQKYNRRNLKNKFYWVFREEKESGFFQNDGLSDIDISNNLEKTKNLIKKLKKYRVL